MSELPPSPGLTVSGCHISRVIDADTVEVEITRKVRVRLLDCWAPETHQTKHPHEKFAGINARSHLTNILEEEGTNCVLHIPTDGDEDLGDGLTFGRVVGIIWLRDDANTNLNERLVNDGVCFKTKQELKDWLT